MREDATVLILDGDDDFTEPLRTALEAAGYSVVLSRNSKADTVTISVDDANRRKRLEEQFLGAQRTEALSLLAGGALHDFTNVLTAIMGQAAMLRQDPQLNDQHQHSVQEIADAAQRASGLARQLTAYSQPLEREPMPLDLGQVISDMSRLLRRLLGEHIDLRKRLEPNLPYVMLDRSETEQMIINLVLNARDAMPDGGMILLETARVKNAGAADEVQFLVRDYGIGMDTITQVRAFEPFFTTRRIGQGAGLGLCTVQRIVEAAQGQVILESELGEGTICRILLPSSDPRSVETQQEATGGTETVLVTEDEALVRSTLSRLLTRFGYKVLSASDGGEALELAEEHSGNIDLLVTDIVMPGMSGTQLAATLTAKRPEVRVLFISGYRAEKKIGPEAHLLPKPFTSKALLKKVREILDTGGEN